MTTPPSPSVADDYRDRLQSILGDAHRIERALTAGGMSRLYLATDTALDRTVVVKLLPPEMVSEQSLARFRREVDITAHLQHPHVLPVLGAGARDGLLYYIMPYVEGESLRHRLDERGALPPTEALRLLREVADALSYAHSKNVIHRDIKPENILIEQGHAVLADFGIARAVLGGSADGARLTGTGLSIGTLGYMPPEQLFGEHTIDHRADIYALGIVAYETLAGAPPFTGATPQATLAAHLSATPTPLAERIPEVPAVVSEAVARALAKTPEERLQTAAELREAFDEGISLLQTRHYTSTTPAPVVVVAPPAKRRWLPWAVAGVATAAAVAAVTLNGRGADPYDRTLVAIAPFEVDSAAAPELRLWREGMVDVLARNLDGAGPLHTVAPTTVIRRWNAAGGETALADETGAGLIVTGSLRREGEGVALRAQVFDARRKRPSAPVTVTGPMTQLGQLANRATVELLAKIEEVGDVKGIRAPSSGLGAVSIDALKLFLEGEQFYRRLAWDSAQTRYEMAIVKDGTFALALRRAGLSIAWQTSTEDSAAVAYMLRAGQHNRNLSRRDSLLVTADSLRSSLNGFDADSTWLPRARRLFATVDSAVARYGTDPEAWFARADARYHYAYGAGMGVVDREILENFDRSIRLDSTFAPAYVHAIEMALALDSAPAALEYARRYLEIPSGAAEASGIRLVSRIIELAQAQSASLATELGDAPLSSLRLAWLRLRRWPDDGETAVAVIDSLYARGRRDVTFADTATARFYSAVAKAYRGRVREAAALFGPQPSRTRVELAMLGAIGADSAATEFRAWLAPTAAPLSPLVLRAIAAWAAAERQPALIDTVLARATALATSATDPRARREARYAAAAAQAYGVLARARTGQDSTSALDQFAALPDSACMACYVDRLQRARLLLAVGRPQDAAILLDERPFSLLSPMEIMGAFHRARAAEGMGSSARAKAIDGYRLVTRAWAGADSSLRPVVDQAAQSLSRLGGAAR